LTRGKKDSIKDYELHSSNFALSNFDDRAN